MAYPDEIIINLSKKYLLTPIQQSQLRSVLLMKELQSLIETQAFDPEDLLIRIPLSADENALSVLSPIAAKALIADRHVLETLREAALKNPAIIKQWDLIKQKIQEIQNAKPGERRLKATKTRELYPDILRFVTSSNAISLGISYPIFQEEFSACPEVLSQYINALDEPIKEASKRYFIQLFESTGRRTLDIHFSPKKSGIQLGTTMTITYARNQHEAIITRTPESAEPINQKITFYIKTHQGDSTSQASSIKPPDPKEMFVYKLLEYIGYGPKTHFFFNPLSPGGFFIATQDMAFTQSPQKHKVFTLFNSVAASYNATPEDPIHEETRRGLIYLDILSRILGLTDTTTNPGNFGVTTINDISSKWRFLDFRVPDRADYYLNEKIFQGFQAGNGLFNYDYADFLRHIFKNPGYARKKMEVAHEFMIELSHGRARQSREGKKMPFLEAISRARKEVSAYITENREALRIDLEGAIEDLNQYAEAVTHNFQLLAEGVAQAQQEFTSGTISSSLPRNK